MKKILKRIKLNFYWLGEENMRMLCKKCHTEMTVMQEDNVSGLICPKCGWNIITTKIDDIMLDTQLYQLFGLYRARCVTAFPRAGTAIQYRVDL